MKKFIITIAITVSACASLAPTAEQKNGMDAAFMNYQNATKIDLVVACGNKAECDKAFSLVNAYINKNSDMRIQHSDDISISTYAPIGAWADNLGKLSFSALKTPGRGDSATIELKAMCSGVLEEVDAVKNPDKRIQSDPSFNHVCMDKLSAIYNEFKPYIENRMH
jgi:hypothetical protein